MFWYDWALDFRVPEKTFLEKVTGCTRIDNQTTHAWCATMVDHRNAYIPGKRAWCNDYCPVYQSELVENRLS